MFQAFRTKNVGDTFVAQIVSGQLQVLYIEYKALPRKQVEVSEIHDCYIFSLECLNILLQLELANFLNDLVFLMLIKEEIQIDRQSIHVFIVVQNLLKEFIFILAEELQRFLRNPNLFCSFEELDRFETNFFKLYNFGSEHSLAQNQGLLVDSSQIKYNFFR